MASPAPVPLAALRAYLDRTAPSREALLARLFALTSCASCACVIALWETLGAKLTQQLLVLLGLVSSYYLAIWVLIRRGKYARSMSWFNLMVEVGFVPAVVVLETMERGPVWALTSPPIVFYCGIIGTGGLRASRKMALIAGALAAAAYLTVYFAVVLPRMTDVQPPLTPPYLLLRAFFLVAVGAITATVAHVIIKSGEEALATVRARDVFGKYFVHERLGAGGMAEVFRATYSPEGGFEKVVALKRLLPEYRDDAAFLHMFREEARVGASLSHPNVVQVLDVGRYAGDYFMALDFVDGPPLSILLKRLKAPLPVRAATYVAAEVASALEYIHGRRSPSGEPLHLVHRDVNAPNILLSKMGEVKLADFGIARAADRPSLTEAGVVKGKTGYMSPEQACGEPIDGRSDLYSLGVTLYEMLSGRRAPAEAKFDLCGIEQGLCAVLSGLLQPEPSQRTATGAVLREQLARLPPELAPIPHGQEELKAAIARASEEPSPAPLAEIDTMRTTPARPAARSVDERA
ncbi:MAG: serine/threonine protein kinase [Myxococcales bacterium]|nr:serine/threonine protein kinase [Myxococcales bacterium]